jgi:hypothetical protein
MCGAIPPLPQYALMAWCSVKAQGQLYLLPSNILESSHSHECNTKFGLSKGKGRILVICETYFKIQHRERVVVIYTELNGLK